jgi:hypothetical protein
MAVMTSASSNGPTGNGPTAAWQQALGAEYAAVFGYGLLGPHLAAAAQTRLARTCQNQHSALAGQTTTALLAAGLTPLEPQVDYPSQFPVIDELSAQRLATRLEEAAASAWRYLVAVAAADPSAASTPSAAQLTAARLAAIRLTAVTALSDSAVRAMRWRALVNPSAPTVAFPGI